VFGWALSAEEKNNPIVQNVVHIEDQYIVNNPIVQPNSSKCAKGSLHNKVLSDCEFGSDIGVDSVFLLKEVIKLWNYVSLLFFLFMYNYS